MPAKAKTKGRLKSTKAHPKLSILLAALPPGRYAGGTLLITRPDALHKEMRLWLSGNDEGRVALGRTAFGDLLVFRDLRKRAAEEGQANAAQACDIVLVDLNRKEAIILAWSVEEFLIEMDKWQFQQDFLRKRLYDRCKARFGDIENDEVYAFVPALAMGGTARLSSVKLAPWHEYQELLYKL
jgi:hypothetical protein